VLVTTREAKEVDTFDVDGPLLPDSASPTSVKLLVGPNGGFLLVSVPMPPTSSVFVTVVVAEPLLAGLVLPVLPAVTSTRPAPCSPEYSTATIARLVVVPCVIVIVPPTGMTVVTGAEQTMLRTPLEPLPLVSERSVE
jgi:hypothetical protein